MSTVHELSLNWVILSTSNSGLGWPAAQRDLRLRLPALRNRVERDLEIVGSHGNNLGCGDGMIVDTIQGAITTNLGS